MIPYLSYVALITAVSFLFYRLLLRRETYFRLNRWFFLGCLLCAFMLPLLPVPGAWSLRSRFQAQAPPRAQISQSLPAASLSSRSTSSQSRSLQPLAPRSLPSVQSSQTGFSSTRPISWTSVKAEQAGYEASKVTNASPAPTADQAVNVQAVNAQAVNAQNAITQNVNSQEIQTTDEYTTKETDADPTYVPSAPVSPDPIRMTASTAHVSKVRVRLNAGRRLVIAPTRAIAPSTTIAPIRAIATGNAIAPTVAGDTAKPTAFRGPTISSALLMQWLAYIYIAGLLVFGLHLLLQLVVLGYQIQTHPVRREGRYRIVEMSGNRAPCSFGPYIFLNPGLYDEETYHQILSHEKIHVAQSHSLDILLAEIGKVIQWFNPFAWMYRKALEANLEFLTDASMVRNPTINVVQYQLSLLRVSVPNLPLSVTSNYNQSLLKKRIAMMHNKPSSLKNSWKYLILLPVLVGMTSIFNDSFAGSSAKGLSTAIISDPFLYGNNPDTLPGRIALAPLAGPAPAADAAPIPAADTTPAPAAPTGPEANVPNGNVNSVQVETGGPESDSIRLKTVDRVVSGYPNPAGMDRVAEGYPVNLSLNVSPVILTDVKVQPEVMVSMEPLPEFMRDGLSDFRSGTWMATIHGDTVEMTMKSDSDRYSNNDSWFLKSELSAIPRGQKGTFTITRDGGVLSLTGIFDGDEGFGHYNFQPNKEFATYLQFIKVDGFEQRRMFGVFMSNLNRSYVEQAVKWGYGHERLSQLESMCRLQIDDAYIQSWKQAGYTDITGRDLVEAKAMEIDPAYVQGLKKAGFSNVSMREAASAKSQGIDQAYMDSWNAAGMKDISLRDLISAKSMGVNPADIQKWRQAGVTDVDIRNVISAKSAGLETSYVEAMKEAGVPDMDLRNLTNAKQAGIDANYVREMRLTGLAPLTLREITMAKYTGLEPAYIQKWQALGYKDLTFNEMTGAKSLHLEPEYAEQFKSAGFTDLTIRDLLTAKSSQLDPAYAAEWKKTGMADIHFRDLVAAKSMGLEPSALDGWKQAGYTVDNLRELEMLKEADVNPDFLKNYTAMGFKDISLRELIRLKQEGITPQYIQDMKNKGFNSTNVDEYLKLKEFK